MGFDQLSPIAPARVRCLLLPCGRITLASFSEAAQRLQKEYHVRLSDVSPEHGSKRAMFSPATYPMGSVFLEFSTSDSPESSKRLAPFELYRRSLIIVGIADGTQNVGSDVTGDTKASGDELKPFSTALESLKEDYASALVYKILVFNSTANKDKHSTEIIHVPKPDETSSTALKTVVCDIVAEFLDELSFYARSIEALPNIETPLAQPLQAVTEARPSSFTRRPQSPSSGVTSPTSTLKDGGRSPYRASMPAHILSSLPTEASSESLSSTLSSPANESKPATTFDDMAMERPSSSSSLHSTQISVQGFGSGTNSEKARNQAKGRIGIVIGSMYLLAGRWSEAVKELTDSANTAKWSNDHAWFAKALDNILVGLLMCAWAGVDVEIPQICYPGEKPPWSFRPTKQTEGNRAAVLRILGQVLPDLTNQILYYYGRAVSSTFTEKAAVPALTFSETALRFARLLSIHRSHYSVLNAQSLGDVISNTVANGTAIPDTIDSLATRAEIASMALRAAAPQGKDEILEPLDHLAVLAGISSILSSLGYNRKKAFILREFIIVLLPLLVRSRKDSAAELGFHPAASLSSAGLTVESFNLTRSSRAGDGNVLSFLDAICEVYGTIRSQDLGNSIKPENILAKDKSLDLHLEKIALLAGKRDYGNIVLKLDVLRWCINICEALPDLPGMLKYSSDLLTTASTGIAPGPESRDAYPSMSMEDQTRTINTIARAAGTAKELGLDQEADYWDAFLVRDVQVLPSSSTNLPIPRRRQDLLAVGSAEIEKKAGPFIYNPFATKAPVAVKEPTLLLAKEATFLVLLQNLFDVALEVEWLKLETTGDAVDAMIDGLSIGPYRTQKLYLKGRPRVVGRATILGCTVKIRGCKARTYPIFKQTWRPVEELKVKAIGANPTKRRPLSSDASQDLLSKTHRPVSVTSSFSIIEDQPLVLLKSTTLTQSAIMVLVGQSRRFQVVLENTSDKIIDFLLVSFTDSTAELLRAAVDNKETSASDLYETEYSAYYRPAFSLVGQGDGELNIKPRDQIVLEVEVYGKPGLHNGSLQISYAHLGIPRDQIEDKFYIRQITVPVVVTVNASVELLRTEILPYSNVVVSSKLSQSQPNTPAFPSSPGGIPKRRLDNVLDEIRRQDLGEDDRCFLLLDFFNAWPRPLRISVEANDAEESATWKSTHEVEDVVQPGTSTRLLMIIPKVNILDSQAAIPIINAANRRQFIVSSNKSSIEAEKTARREFWYKEEILKSVRATWADLSNNSSGQINLRAMRVSSRMIDLLQTDLLDMDIRLTSNSAANTDTVQELTSSHYTLQKDTFATLSTHIRNRSDKAIRLLLRLQPSIRQQSYNIALDLSRKMAFNGLLQRVLPEIPARSSVRVDLGLVFFCGGEYEVSACAEELRAARPSAGSTADAGDAGGTGDGKPAESAAANERRVWHCKRPCFVDVL